MRLLHVFINGLSSFTDMAPHRMPRTGYVSRAPTVTNSYHQPYFKTPLKVACIKYIHVLTHMCVCSYVCVRARVCLCLCVCVMCVCVRVRARAYDQMRSTASTSRVSGAPTPWQSDSRYKSASS